jgi:aspartyl protease family protein
MLALTFWLLAFGGAYLFFDARLKPTVATASNDSLAKGEVVIPRSRDGHYYVKGSINGKVVVFVVDTGATMVSVSSGFARDAGLPRGVSAQFSTAGGVVEGEVVTDQTIEAGGIRVSPLNIAVGIQMSAEDPALLGQNFLRRVEVSQANDQMVLRLKPGR